MQTALAKIDNISNNYNLANPLRAGGLMIEVFNEDTKLTLRATQMYLLQALVRRKLATEDVLSIELKSLIET